MKPGYRIKHHYCEDERPNFITVSNYHDLNQIHLHHFFAEMFVRLMTTDATGVWNIKYKNK